MLDVDRVLRQERLMRAMTGLTLPAFARLLVSFSHFFGCDRSHL